MAAFLPWFDQNWFTLIQTLGIMGGLWLTSATLRRDRQARKLGDLLTLAGQHRDLWSDAHRRPELGRIMQADVDLVAQPVSTSEEEFLNLVIVHFYTGWLLAREAALLRLDVLGTDAGSFFALPLPRWVWAQTRHRRDPQFIRFVERAVARGKAGRGFLARLLG